MMNTFLPAMRQLVAIKLEAEGFSQSKTASMLGVTQASVSLYLSSSAAKSYSALSSLSLSKEEADRYASLLAEDVKGSPSEAVSTLDSIWTSLLGRGLVCDAHRKLYPSLAQCDFCLGEYGGRSSERSDALAHVAEAVKVLETAPGFPSVMPEVSVNIAYLPTESNQTSEVIAIPGRIVKVKNSAKATLPPEYGVSGHLARILLLVRRRLPEFRAVINLRYDRGVDRVLKKARLARLTIGGYARSGTSDGTLDALSAVLQKEHRSFDVIVDTGGEGVEPNVYLFGTDAVEVALLAKKLARMHSG